MRKFLTALAVLCLLLALTIPVFAEDVGVCGEDIGWSLEGSTLTISGTGKMYDFAGGTAPWVHSKDSITTVKISDGITYIGAGSFQDYDKLTSVSFGSDVYEIGAAAFKDCDGLTSLSMPASFKVFGEESFRGCDNLKRIDCTGRFPSFRSNCLWDTYVNIYYPAERPWNVKDIKDLEKAFNGRIEFLCADGTDPVVPTEAPTEEPTEKPTQPPATTEPSTEGTEPSWSLPPITEPATVTRATEPTKPTESGSGFQLPDLKVTCLLACVAMVGLLAAFAAIVIQINVTLERKRRAERRRKRKRPNSDN